MLGFARADRTRWRRPMGARVTGAPFVRRVTVLSPFRTSLPSILASRSGRDAATRSTTFLSRASFSEREALSRTALSAQSTFRPLPAASERA